VRYYTIKTLSGSTLFTCTRCSHSVTTSDFSSTIGNRRTQAASAINRHVATSHFSIRAPRLPSLVGADVR